jgi:RimJ/RimL family protein N-acetyltransferase
LNGTGEHVIDDRWASSPGAGAPSLDALERLLRGPRCRLSATDQADVPEIARMANDPEIGQRWRMKGQMLSPDMAYAVLWKDAYLNLSIRVGKDPSVVGLFSVTGFDHTNRHAALSILLGRRLVGSGLGVEAMALGINFTFASTPLRKLYGQVPAYNFDQFASGSAKFFEVEGRLAEHEYFQGTYWDMFIISVTRERWEDESVARLLRDRAQGVGVAVPLAEPDPPNNTNHGRNNPTK